MNAQAALLSPETGICDVHMIMKNFAADIEGSNGVISYANKVTNIKFTGQEYEVFLKDGSVFCTEYLINAAGLGAVQISAMLNLTPETLYPCKGSYFYYSGPHQISHLVYPIPHQNLSGLGVHATLDLGGRLKFGPDTEYIENTEDFSVDEKKRAAFASAGQKIIKGLDPDKFQPDQAGIRPKIQGPNDKQVKDFYIREESVNALPKFINLLGIESPGITSALAIGEYVAALMGTASGS